MTNLRFTVHGDGVGVTVHHVDLASGVAPYHTLQIRALLNRHRVVLFPDQTMNDDQLLDFAYRFGAPFAPSRDTPVLGSSEGGAGGVIVVGNRATEYRHAYLGFQEVLPHSDHQWLRCPSAGALLYAEDLEEGSPPTVWTDMARAYATLDDDTRDLIEDLRLITYNPFYRPFGTVRAHYVDRRVDVPPGAVFPHPLVRTHPDTGEKILYLNAAYEVELAGVAHDAGAALIAQLQQHVERAPGRYVHHWRKGDLVLWENHATVHYRPAFAQSVRRVLKRVSIGGGIPF